MEPSISEKVGHIFLARHSLSCQPIGSPCGASCPESAFSVVDSSFIYLSANMSIRVLATSGLKASQMNNVMARMMSTGTPLAAKIGFIGLGNMGGHMVKNLINKVCIADPDQLYQLNILNILIEIMVPRNEIQLYCNEFHFIINLENYTLVLIRKKLFKKRQVL